MTTQNPVNQIHRELQEGLGLAKCKKCGCMKEALQNLQQVLPSLKTKSSAHLHTNVEDWLKELEPTKYSCLGCEHCYPAVVTNVFNQAFSKEVQMQSSTCGLEVSNQTWPPIIGEYFVSDDRVCSVAVSTLASVELAEAIAEIKPKGLCIVGKTETENIGIDKIIKNTISNPSIRFLIVAGKDPQGHQSGKTLIALWEYGVDENMQVNGSPAINPVLKNVTLQEVEAFRKQIKVTDLIGCEDPAKIANKIKELARTKNKQPCSCKECVEIAKPIAVPTVPVIDAKMSSKVEVDKTGYYVIIPKQPNLIVVEHYSYDNKLLRIIEGKDAKSIYTTIIEKGWVTQLSHAAYLGKELARAELSLKLGFRYVQDEAQYHNIRKSVKQETKDK